MRDSSGDLWRDWSDEVRSIGKAHAALGDAVEVGGLVDATAVAAHGVRGVVVGHDEEDVGPGHSGIPIICKS